MFLDGKVVFGSETMFVYKWSMEIYITKKKHIIESNQDENKGNSKIFGVYNLRIKCNREISILLTCCFLFIYSSANNVNQDIQLSIQIFNKICYWLQFNF